jgi:hypothetical protein
MSLLQTLFSSPRIWIASTLTVLLIAASCAEEDSDLGDDTEAQELWLLEIEYQYDPDNTEESISENFMYLSTYSDEDDNFDDTGWGSGSSGEWTYSTEYSPGVSCMSLLKSKTGDLWVHFDGDFWHAERSDGTTTATWTYLDKEDNEYVEEDYVYTSSSNDAVDVSLVMNTSGSSIQGTYIRTYNNSTTVTESDIWTSDTYPEGTYFFANYLDDYWEEPNESDTRECEDDMCRLSVTNKRVYTYTVTGSVIKNPSETDLECVTSGGTSMGNPYN